MTRQVDEYRVAEDLRGLTALLDSRGFEASGGLLGGESGYGAHFDSDVFQMHPFCWCESPECPWCLACDCKVDDLGEAIGDSSARYRVVSKCNNCRNPRREAPNFLHKPSGTEVRWYKYIGRSMEIDLHGDWNAIVTECRVAATEAGAR